MRISDWSSDVCSSDLEKAIKGDPGDLRRGVPDRHVEDADRNRALAMTAGLLIRHQRCPDLMRVEILAALVEQRLRLGRLQPRNEPLAQQTLRGIAAVGVEAVTDHRAPVTRSEEHTSELQSLMSISYAVFCLK